MNNQHNAVAIWVNNTKNILPAGEKPSNQYLCHLCGALYSSSYTLSRHIDLKHESEHVLQCTSCFYSTNRRDNLHRQFWVVHKLNQPFPEDLRMPSAPEYPARKKPQTKKTNPLPEATTSADVPTNPQVSIAVEYEKFPDSTGAYLYYNTLRPGQKPFNWVPTTIDIHR